MKRRLLTLLLAAMLLPGCSAAEPGEGMILLALNVGKADCLLLGSGGSMYMIDTGTAESMYIASSAIRDFQRKTGTPVGNLEALGYELGLIDRETLEKSAEALKMTAYGQYLKTLTEK